MSGHFPIFEFSDYETKILKRAVEILNEMEDLGFGPPDEDMMYALQEEIKRRNEN